MTHGPAQGAVHGGPTTVAGHRARWSSAERLLRGTVAHRRWCNGERGARGVQLGPHRGAGGSDGDERYVWWRTTELSHYIGAEGEGGGR
jgi:hypothetical protein